MSKRPFDKEGVPHLFEQGRNSLITPAETQRQSVEMQSAILDALPAHIALIDENGVVRAVNAAWRSFATANDYQHKHLGIGSNYLSICEQVCGNDADDARKAAEGIQKVLKRELKTFSMEYPCHSPEENRWFRMVVTPFRDKQHVGAVITHINISEIRETADKLREQAELLDKAQDAILVRDLEHNVLYWNRSAEVLYGWSKVEVLGKSIIPLLYHNPTAVSNAERITLEKGEWTGELEHYNKEGQRIIVQSRWSLVRDAKGQPKAFLAINTDVTEKKKLEAQYLRAQRLEGIGTLAGGIAHDLNNLLAPILMGTGLLRECEHSESALRIIKTIEQSAERGAQLVRQVLGFARGIEGARIPIDLKHIVHEIESILHDTFPKQIVLKITLPKGLWLVNGDPTQINQILLNLCVNARDAMPDGGKITIEACNTELDETYVSMNPNAKAGAYVLLTVSDNGCGIPKETLKSIFDPFFTTKPPGKGTGLGLATAHSIVHSHGGFISVYSEEGRGSAFKIYLPANTTTEATEYSQTEQTGYPRGQGECILVVDDEENIRDITGKTLERFGYRVMSATNGAEAVALYAEHRGDIAVVLTDMAMPIMDGQATINAIKAITPRVRIIASSGNTSTGGVGKAAGSGIKYFIAKPYTAERLLKVIRQIISDPNPV